MVSPRRTSPRLRDAYRRLKPEHGGRHALRDAGVEAIGIHPPLDLCLAEDGRLVSFETRHIAEMTEHGIVPVLHGDVVMDRLRGGSCIVSGDQLVTRLAAALESRRVGLATDVPGVLANGAVVPRIDRSTVESLDVGGSGNTDVTGGGCEARSRNSWRWPMPASIHTSSMSRRSAGSWTAPDMAEQR